MPQSRARLPADALSPTVASPDVAGDAWCSNDFARSQLGAVDTATTPFLTSASGADRARRIERATQAADAVQQMALDATGTLIPAYLAARDALDVDAVAELGGRIVGAVGAVRGGRAALDPLLGGLDRRSLPGSDPADDIALAGLDAGRPELDLFVSRLEAEAHDALVPHRFRGVEVGHAELGAGPAPVSALGRELQRTIGMLGLVGELTAKVTAAGAPLTPAAIADLRRELEPWAARPLDLAFLRAALGPVWTVLDAQPALEPDPFALRGPGFLPASRPSDLLADATRRAEVTGWLGDTGQFDIDTAHVLLLGGDQEGALFALRRLYSADRASRPKLLEQLHKRGDLAKLCAALGEDAVEAMYAEVPAEYPTVRAELLRHFRPSFGTILEDDDEQAERADLGALPVLLADPDKATAEFALDDLFELPTGRRTDALEALRRRGLLEGLLKQLGWRPIKDLHDSLAGGYADLKTQLQGHFLGKGKFGPSLDSEWESHESSLYSLVGRIPYAGKPLNVALDVATFGFNSSYGQARDANSRGETSDAEYSRTRTHIAGRTALMAAVSIVTGGTVDKFARGAGASATLAGASSGMVGGVAGLGASDAYNVLVSGEQEGMSSVEDYVKAAVLGGTMGAAFGRITQGLGPKSAKYTDLPDALPGGTAPKQLPAGSVGPEPVPGAKAPGATVGKAAPTAEPQWPSKPGDPAFARSGPARLSHADELAAVMEDLRKAGVTVRQRPDALGYNPSSKPGVPGELTLDPDASWSAIQHELQHVMDDAARGFPGAEKMYDPKVRWASEQSAYGKEMAMARRSGDEALVRELAAERLREWQRIFMPHLGTKGTKP